LGDNVPMRRQVAFLCVATLSLVVVGVPSVRAWVRHPLTLSSPEPSQGSVLSPHERTDGQVDGATLSIVYGRPSMRGRTIFGGLVPYGRVWCPGADQCTTLSTDRDLQFTGVRLQAGEYSMWMEPTETVWTLIFNSDAHAFHTRYDPRLDIGKVTLQKQASPSPIERLTFTIEPGPAGPGGAIVMSWETTRVSAPFTVVR
jgi:DUF2911 family protein